MSRGGVVINSVSSQGSILSSYYNHGTSSPKIEVPVLSSVAVYAQYKHVRGIPATGSQEPVSLSRAQVIDNMVAYLNGSSEDLTLDTREEYNVEELEGEVHRVINEELPQFNSLPGFSADTGVIFSLTV